MSEDLAATLRLIAEHAPRLRAAGVETLSVGGITMSLLGPDPAPMVAIEDDPPKSLAESPETYGLPEGAEVPGFRRPED